MRHQETFWGRGDLVGAGGNLRDLLCGRSTATDATRANGASPRISIRTSVCKTATFCRLGGEQEKPIRIRKISCHTGRSQGGHFLQPEKSRTAHRTGPTQTPTLLFPAGLIDAAPVVLNQSVSCDLLLNWQLPRGLTATAESSVGGWMQPFSFHDVTIVDEASQLQIHVDCLKSGQSIVGSLFRLVWNWSVGPRSISR